MLFRSKLNNIEKDVVHNLNNIGTNFEGALMKALRSLEQNIYSLFHYMDRKGKLFTAEECRRELAEYKKRSHKYAKKNKRPGRAGVFYQNIRRRGVYGWFYLKKAWRALIRRMKAQNPAAG